MLRGRTTQTLLRRQPGGLATPAQWQRHRSGAQGKQIAGTAAGSVEEVERWAERLEGYTVAVDQTITQAIEQHKHGKRKGTYNPKQSSQRRRYVCSASLIGALLTPYDKMPVRSTCPSPVRPISPRPRARHRRRRAPAMLPSLFHRRLSYERVVQFWNALPRGAEGYVGGYVRVSPPSGLRPMHTPQMQHTRIMSSWPF